MLNAMIRGTRGMVATCGYNTGDVIHRLAGRVTAFPTADTFAISDKMHIDDCRVRWMRRSDSPSAVLLNGTIYAKKKICVGDEITVMKPVYQTGDP